MAETVLVAEDEKPLRILIRRILQMDGYCVLEAGDAAGAIHLCETHPGPIQLLVSDVIMPGMTGCKLAANAKRFRPHMKLLLISGYGDDVIARHGANTGEAFLQKPFTPQHLCRKVRELLTPT